MKKYAIPVAVIAVIVIAAVAFYSTQMGGQSETTPAMTTETVSPTQEMTQQTGGVYDDGVYAVTGNYVSPGGPREIGVTLTLENGVITDAQFEALATDATSQRFQNEFGENFTPMVVGKNIDEVELTKVSGSSLTPIGFNDAVEQIKAEASQS